MLNTQHFFQHLGGTIARHHRTVIKHHARGTTKTQFAAEAGLGLERLALGAGHNRYRLVILELGQRRIGVIRAPGRQHLNPRLFATIRRVGQVAHLDAHGVQPNAKPGDLRFVDTDENGELNDDDRAYVGSGIPAFEYGLTFNANYKKFDFSLLFQGSQGNEIYNGTKVYLYRRQVDDKNFSSDLLDAWTPSNTNTDVPRVSMLDANQNIRPSDYFMEDGSYLRLKNLQVGYSFGEATNMFSSARVYVAAQNLMTITGYSGYDPGNTGYQQFSRGVDVGLYPLSRSFIMGVQLKF